MRKFIALVLICSTIILSACSFTPSAAKKPESNNDAAPTVVKLTPENFMEYFEVSCSYEHPESYTKNGITFASVEMILNVYAVQSGTLNNVEVTLEISPPTLWGLSVHDSAYATEDPDTGNFFVNIRIPVSGEYSETHTLTALMTTRPKTACKIKVVSVSGTFGV